MPVALIVSPSPRVSRLLAPARLSADASNESTRGSPRGRIASLNRPSPTMANVGPVASAPDASSGMLGVLIVPPPTVPSPGMSTLGMENDRLFQPRITALIADRNPAANGANMLESAPLIRPGMPLTKLTKVFQEFLVLFSAVETTDLTVLIPFLSGVNTRELITDQAVWKAELSARQAATMASTCD